MIKCAPKLPWFVGAPCRFYLPLLTFSFLHYACHSGTRKCYKQMAWGMCINRSCLQSKNWQRDGETEKTKHHSFCAPQSYVTVQTAGRAPPGQGFSVKGGTAVIFGLDNLFEYQWSHQMPAFNNRTLTNFLILPNHKSYIHFLVKTQENKHFNVKLLGNIFDEFILGLIMSDSTTNWLIGTI